MTSLNARAMEQWLRDKDPDRYRRLVADGDLEEYCQMKADHAAERVTQLVQTVNYLDFEAEEIARAEMFT